MSSTSVPQTDTKSKRRTPPKWSGTPGYSGNMNYGATQPASKFNDDLFGGSDTVSDDDNMIFSARR